jgi:adhesin transport system outer membrane protein
LQTHPSIEMAKESIKGAEFNVDSAFWEYFPTPSIDYSIKSADKDQITARLEQPIWTGGKIDSAYDKAKALQKEANYELGENRYKLVEDYVDALNDYLKSKDRIKVLNNNKKDFKELSKMLDRFMKAGILSKTDKNLLNSRIASISSDLVIAKAKHKVSNIKLEILSGKSISCNVSFKMQDLFPMQVDIDRLIISLRDTHPALKMMDAKILASIAEVDNAKSQLWPSLTIRAEHTYGTIYENSDSTDDNLVYLNISASTGAGLSGLSNIDKARVEVSRTRLEKNTKEKELLDRLMADYTNYVTAVSQLKMVEKDIEIAQLIFDSNQRLFVSQKKSWLDLVNSLSELSNQKIKYVELLVDKNILSYKIAISTGKIDIKTLEVNGDI